MTASDGAVARAHTLLQLGRATEAEHAYRQLLAGDPASTEIRLGLARALLPLKRPEEAKELARGVLAGDPNSLDGLIVLTASSLASGDTDGALRAAHDAVRLAPGWSVTQFNLGSALHRSGRHDEALAAIDLARSLDPEDARTEVLRATVLQTMGRFEDAQVAVLAALRLDPDNADAHRVNGVLRLLRPGTGDARAASGTALRLDPTSEWGRDLHATTLKSRNPLYRWLLRLGEAQSRWPSWAQWALVLSPLIASRLLQPVQDQLWGKVLLVVVVAFVVLSWSLEPLMNCVLVASRTGRGLLSPLTRRATYGFAGYLVAGVVTAVLSLLTGNEGWAIVALGLALWGVCLGYLGTVKPTWLRWAYGLHAGGVLLSVAAVAMLALGSTAGPLGAVLIFTGVGMLWFTRFS